MYPSKSRRADIKLPHGLLRLTLAVACLVMLALTPVATSGGERSVRPGGSGSIEHVKGIAVVSLSGGPREMGYWHGKLLGDRMIETEAAFTKLMPPIPGGFIGRWLVKTFIMLKLGSIERHLDARELEEMKGMAEAGPDKSRGYRELLYYHVLQDIGQNYACTGGAAVGKASALDGPVAGRNFDMNRDGVLDPLKTVFYYRPEGGQSYATVAWPGMVGAVTGMNESGLCVMVFSAHSETTSLTGVPVAFMARRLLADASDVDGAVELVRSTARMGSNTFLLVDRKKAVAVEFDAGNFEVRTDEAGLIAAANHFLCATFARDRKNAHQARYSDSSCRLERMGSLLSARRRVGVRDMAAALRDHGGPKVDVMAWGDPAAINNTKDAHSVVFDPKGMRFWVSTQPYAYGEFVGFRITRHGLERSKDLPASAYVCSEEGTMASLSYDYQRRAEALAEEGFRSGAMTCAMQAMGLDPSNYMAAIHYGRLCMDDYRYTDAYTAFDSAVLSAPDSYPAMSMALACRGEAARRLGMREDARLDFSEVLCMGCSEEAVEMASDGLRYL